MEGQIGPAAVKPRWLVSPAFDLCFLANAWWPLVVLGAWWLSETATWFDFWQIYFLTTPHRWLTLLLVAADPDRRAGRTGWLLFIAFAAAVAVGSVWLTTGELVCLALVDYLWNAWHFGSQHGGIARMYARRDGVVRSPLQTWSLRLFVFYTALRMAGWTTGWIEADARGALLLMTVDVVVIVTAVLSVGWRSGPSTVARKLYLVSVVTAYAALLVAVNARAATVVAGLVAATAAMHAVEYLAIVTFYARRREGSGSPGMFRAMAKQWTLLLGVYVVLLGSVAFLANERWREIWLAINLAVAFVHYAYDGMIWKLREAGTSSTLGVELAKTAGGTP